MSDSPDNLMILIEDSRSLLELPANNENYVKHYYQVTMRSLSIGLCMFGWQGSRVGQSPGARAAGGHK